MRTAYSVAIFGQEREQRRGQITHLLQQIYLFRTHPQLGEAVANGVNPTLTAAQGQISPPSNHHSEMWRGSNPV